MIGLSGLPYGTSNIHESAISKECEPVLSPAEAASGANLWTEAKTFRQTSSPFRQTLSINVTAIPDRPVYLQKLCHILAEAGSATVHAS